MRILAFVLLPFALATGAPARAQGARGEAPSPPALHELRAITDGVVADDARWASGFGLEGPGGGPVYSLATLGCDVYVGGYFAVTTVQGTTRNIARWDGYNWHSLGQGVDNQVTCMAVFDPDADGPEPPSLYAGGYFTLAGGEQAYHVARWDGANWHDVAGGLTGVSVNQVTALAMLVHDDGSGPALYVAGRFQQAGGAACLNIARWDGAAWSSVGPGFSGVCQPVPSPPNTTETYVAALASFDDTPGVPGALTLYAGGCFDSVGGLFAKNIARWDGAVWNSLGGGGFNGVDGAVNALLVHDDGTGPGLYVGGLFLRAGIHNYRFIARWNADGMWTPLGTPLSNGVNNWVQCLSEYQDSASGPASLYIGGLFDRAFAGGVTIVANRVARWRLGAWQPLDSGVNASPAAMVVFDDPREGGARLYVGGSFSIAGSLDVNSIARWNGTQWSALATQTGDGMNNEVGALEVYDDPGPGGPSLYAGGRFTAASGGAARAIARWNGAGWSPVGGGMLGGAPDIVHAMTVWDDDGPGPRAPGLYCGGRFANAGATVVNSVARWNGAAWEALGVPPNVGVGGLIPRIVYALRAWDDGGGEALYVGGRFTTAGGAPANAIAKWDGATWSALGDGLAGLGADTSVHALAAFNDGSGDALYAAGNFTSAGGSAANFIAKWNGASWSPVGPPGPSNGLDARADALMRYDGRLIVGGRFTVAGGVQTPFIAAWNGSAWATLDQGLNNWVFSLASHDDGSGPALYAGGFFTGTWNSLARRYIAKWNGSAWSPLGSGTDLTVLAMRSFDDGAGPGLWVGGGFTSAGNQPSAYIARWGDAPFQPAVPVPAGDAPSAVAALDFDNDPFHLPDLAVVNAQSNDVTVLFNTGTPGAQPTFTLPSPANTYGVGATPLAIAADDLTGDDVPDLVVANALSNSLTILLNDGDGAFANAGTLPTGMQPVAVSLTDLDGDGNPDLVVCSRLSDEIQIFRGMGGGAFSPDQPQQVPPNSGPSGVGAGDLDNDKDVDVVATCETSGTVVIFPNMGNVDGVLSFGPPVIFSVATCGDPRPRSLALADLNLDGLLDVAVANSGTDSVAILLNLGGSSGAWQGLRPPTPLSVGVAPVSITAGQFFGSVRSDLVTANAFSNPEGSVSVLRNITPINSFGLAQFDPAVELPTPPDPAFVTGQDLNANGSLDVVLANGFVTSGRARGSAFPGAFARVETGAAGFMINQASTPLVAPCPGDANGDRVVDFLDLNRVLSFYGISGEPGYQPGDLDGDGDVDFTDLNVVLSYYATTC